MSKRIEEKDRLGEDGPQDGPIGAGTDTRRPMPAGGEPNQPHGDAGVGGQRHPGGSSRDPQAQGRRTEEEAHG